MNGLFDVEKKNKSLDSDEPVLRMIINVIPANALQETIEADIRTLPYFGQWSTISVDEEDRVVVLERAGRDVGFQNVPPRASVVQIPVSGQTRFGPIRLEVGAQSVGRGKRVPCGGSRGHGVEVIMRTLTTDSQEEIVFPPQAHGSRVGPIQRGSARWSCSAKRQAT